MAQREERALTAPTVFIDGKRLKVIPKSVKNEYPGAAKSRSVSSGGGSIELVHGLDLEEMICKITLKLANTAEYAEFAQDLAAKRVAGETSTIKIVEDSIQDHYDQCMLQNKIEIPHDPTGEIELEYMGRYSAVV